MQGHYYSWDIRLLSLFLSLVFLITYYKRYHMTRDLASQPVCGGWLHYLPVCCCCLADTALAAPANEVFPLPLKYRVLVSQRSFIVLNCPLFRWPWKE